jgi:peptidoglycan/LPS O-acetylase OafA/YrhL
MDTAKNDASRRIRELDGLRGIAILIVVVWHYFYFYPAPGHHPASMLRSIYLRFEQCIATGWTGVDLFFVLSGFLIGGILLDAKGSPDYFKTFYARRFYRIIPLYYVWIAGYIASILLFRVVPGWNVYASGELGFWPILSHFLFIQNLGFISYTGISGVWFISTWSLAVEEQFYLIAPVVIRICSRRILPALLCSVVIAAPLFRLFVHNYWHPVMTLDAAYILMPCRADGLSIGVLAAYFWRSESFRGFFSQHIGVLYGSCGLFLIGVAALNFLSPDQHSIAMISLGYTWFALFYVQILLLALIHPAGPVGIVARIKFLRYLGGISYCVYIVHQAALPVAGKLLHLLPMFSPSLQAAIAPFLAIGICLGIAILSWRYFESRMIARGHSYRYSARLPVSSS